MRPTWLRTKIFLDSGDPDETLKTLNLLGFLDGQTTNPTLIAKNPSVKQRLESGEKFTREEIYEFYQRTINRISTIIPRGAISAEVYSDSQTDAWEMIDQALEMYGWAPMINIKFPITSQGLKAAHIAVKNYMRVNMTLCFSQEQAAAVYRAAGDTRSGRVFVSPFIGRLDDSGYRGVDLVENILKMYRESEDKGFGSVEVLGASVRNLDQFLYLLKLNVDIITAPFKVLAEWADVGMVKPTDNFDLVTTELKPIDFRSDLSLVGDWEELNVGHDLTDAGLKRFTDDWNNLIKTTQ